MRGIGLSVLPEFYDYGIRAEAFTMEPLLVTVRTMRPVSFRDPIALDSLIAKGLYYDLFKGNPLPSPDVAYWIPLPLENEKFVSNLPLWKSTDFFPVDSKSYGAFIHRRTGNNPYSQSAMMPTLAGKKVRRQPPSILGQYMDYRVPDRRVVAEQWYAMCLGNLAEVERLLAYLKIFGRAGRSGLGRVLEWRVEPLEREFSLTDDGGNYLRPVPIEDITAEWSGSFQGWTPPYWKRDTWRMCHDSLARKI